MSNALLIVDVQQYFMKDAPEDLPKRIVNHHKALNYDHIIFTRFKSNDLHRAAQLIAKRNIFSRD